MLKRPPPSSRSRPAPEVKSVDDLVAYLHVHKSSIYKLSRDGKVPGRMVGRHWRFHKSAVDAWLSSDGSKKDGESRRPSPGADD